MTNALANSTQLKVLDLSANRNITTEGWRSLFNALQSHDCVLQGLLLYNNGFSDEAMTHLSNALANNCVLRHLNLGRNDEITISGWKAFAAVLQHPNSALETVHLDRNHIDDNVLVTLANSLMHSTVLKELFLDDLDRSIITVTGWDAFSNALCNKTSIDATFNSNHTLQRFFHQERHEAQLPTYLILLLRLNRELTKVEAARWKILQVHFSGAFNMQPFIDMDLKALPHAIAWMAKDNHGSSLTYKFVRNTTFFFNVGSGGMEAANEPEPKRQKT